MILNRIDFPHKLIQAAKKNQLVIFAGAGVSVGAPTKYPNFNDLIDEIYVQVMGSNEDEISADVRAGDLERKNVDIHNRVAKRLDMPRKRPNRLHNGIVNLFRNNEIRIVTTNFDLMFEKSIRQSIGRKFNVYSAPALPDGCDFSGVVHIHGNVKDDKHIVVTDSDFGKAYLIDGYATRFITNVFKTYSVLFIGYSYNDVMMNYLTKALSTSDKKDAYILTDNDSLDWLSIGIKPLLFEKENYEQLYDAFEEFSDYCGRDLIDVNAAINYITANDPPKDDETISVIREFLSEYDTANLFLSKLKNDEWFEFFYEHGFIDNLYKRDVALNELEKSISNWIARNCLNESLLVSIEANNNIIHSDFERQIAIHLVEKDNYWFSLYAMILLPRISDPWILNRVFEKALDIDKEELAVACFCRMMRPVLSLEKSFGYFTMQKRTALKERFPLTMCFSNDWNMLCGTIKQAESYYTLVYEATSTLRKLYDTERIIADKNKYTNFNLDYIDLDASSDDEPVSVICNVILTALASIDCVEFAKAWITEQLETNRTLLRRIAIKHLEQNNTISVSEKYRYVIALDNIVEPFVKQEIYYLLQKIFEQATQRNVISIIKKIEKQYNSSEDTGRYEVFNLVHWLHERVNNSDAKNALLELETRIIHDYPQYTPRKHPEKDIIFGEITYGDGVNPSIVERLIGENYNKINAIIKNCIKEYSADDFDVQASLRAAATKSPEWATKCIVDFIKHDKTCDYLTVMVDGLSLSSDYSFVRDFLDDLSSEIIPSSIVKALSRMLSKYVQSQEKIDASLGEWVMEKTILLWEYKDCTPVPEAPSYQRAINSASGYIGQIFFDLIIKCEETRKEVIAKADSLLEESDLDFSCIIMGHSAYLYNVDSRWVETRLLPLLKSSNSTTFFACWDALLLASRSMSFEYAHSIKNYYDEAIGRVDILSEQTAIMFAKQYAILVTYESKEKLKDTIRFIRDVNEALRNAFLSEISYILRVLATDTLRKTLWRRWLRGLIENRLSNVPTMISGTEVVIMLNWSLYVSSDDFAEIVGLIVKTNCVDREAISHFLYNLDQNSNYRNDSGAAIKILKFLDACGVSFNLYGDVIASLNEIWKTNGISSENERLVQRLLLKLNYKG